MAVSVEEAFNIIYKNTSKTSFEIVPIENAQGRICAQNINATSSLPKFDNSSMDGYAILFDDVGNTLQVVNKIFAGDNIDINLEFGTCIKVMTGAKIPKNTQAVVPQENVEILEDNLVKIPTNVEKFQHIKFVGEDIKEGNKLINDGDEINFSKITLLASQGISHIKIYKKPKIIVFSSGEELKNHYEEIESYQIFNSNTPTLLCRAKELGCEVNFIGKAQDSVESLQELINNSLDANLIITTGGVSVGEADFTKEAFNSLKCKTLFNGVKIKPGKPSVFGKIENSLVLNLPGTPLANALFFELFGKIIIQILSGSNEIFHNYIKTKISTNLQNERNSKAIITGFFDGEYFTPSSKSSPGMISILSSCNAFIVLDESIKNIKKDDNVKILPINWKFFNKNKKDYLTKWWKKKLFVY